MTIDYNVTFSFALPLPLQAALGFVRDVKTSLQYAAFLKEIAVTPDPGSEHQLVRASLPINAALFGQHDLSFKSRLVITPHGARLEGLSLGGDKAGWAELSGEAEVNGLPTGSMAHYTFQIVVHLELPTPEKWGGKALLKMIDLTARTVLASVTEGFPQAVQRAAAETALALTRQVRSDLVNGADNGVTHSDIDNSGAGTARAERPDNV